jgi:flagellar basal body-associated protein FliL
LKQPEGLISVLLDFEGDISDRDDAAMDLYKYKTPEVERALLEVLFRHHENEIIIDSAAETLMEIWRDDFKNKLHLVEQMHPKAKRFFSTSK